MDFRPPRKMTAPEAEGAKRLRKLMHAHRWHTEKLHGNRYQSGLPDLMAFHIKHGFRFIETKAEASHGKLSVRQVVKFTLLEKHGAHIWVCRDERDYYVLFKEPNWRMFIL